MSSYTPPLWLRNNHANTIAAASSLRKLYALHVSKKLRRQSQSKVLHLTNDVRLQVLLNTHNESANKPLVFILHGWLGCAGSLYLLPLASQLYAHGFNVARLNYRDHGGTEHLNKELFHSCRLDEVMDSIKTIQAEIAHKYFYLVGFSLGGNFALRVGAKAKTENLSIDKIISICPVLDASNALNETQNMLKVYTEYYLRRWKIILKQKHEHFPEMYDLDKINEQRSLASMTEHLLLRYTEFDSVTKYLRDYSITGDCLRTLNIESHVYVSNDDPVIPASDHTYLYRSNHLNLYLTEHGGHCGYLNGLFNRNWIDQKIFELLTKNEQV